VEKVKVIDVRKRSEYEAEHINEAYSRPLASINEWIKDINKNISICIVPVDTEA
jgi:rhodanese-related sulfurtransferase